MKLLIITVTVFLFTTIMNTALAQPIAQSNKSPVGLWHCIDDQTGDERAIMKVYEQNGRLFGRIERTHNPADANNICKECPDERQGKTLGGLVILRNLVKDGDEWTDGDILDPETGAIYQASARLTDHGSKLQVRGFLGISLLGRTQTWIRAL